jgi:hypothetical protein
LVAVPGTNHGAAGAVAGMDVDPVPGEGGLLATAVTTPVPGAVDRRVGRVRGRRRRRTGRSPTRPTVNAPATPTSAAARRAILPRFTVFLPRATSDGPHRCRPAMSRSPPNNPNLPFRILRPIQDESHIIRTSFHWTDPVVARGGREYRRW